MPFSAVCDWTLGRSLLIVLLAWPVCHWLERCVRASSRSTWLLVLLASPFLLPELLLGYLFAPFVAGVPWQSELACAAVLLLRGVPVGVIALQGTPASPISPAALHLSKMSCRTAWDRWHLWRCYFHGPVRRALPSLGLMFLISFQEFEAAAFFGSVSWTDRLFTEHAVGGMSLLESTRFLVRPLAIQMAALGLIFWSLSGLSHDRAPGVHHEEPLPSRRIRRFSWGYAGIALVLGVVGPLVLLSTQLAEGWNWLMTQNSAWKKLGTEICTAGLIGLVAGLAAWHAARWLLSPGRSRWISGACLVPGMCGGLTVSLYVVWLSSRPLLQGLSMTPVGWVIALAIWLLPRAVLLQLWLSQQTDPLALHLLELLRQSPDRRQRRTAWKWQWRWQVEPQIAACGLLCYWAYLDLTAAALLAPPGMASIMVRLYNFMHFGHSAAMSTEAALAMLAPLALGGLILAAARTGRWRRPL